MSDADDTRWGGSCGAGCGRGAGGAAGEGAGGPGGGVPGWTSEPWGVEETQTWWQRHWPLWKGGRKTRRQHLELPPPAPH